jgi:hypothetical protein
LRDLDAAETQVVDRVGVGPDAPGTALVKIRNVIPNIGAKAVQRCRDAEQIIFGFVERVEQATLIEFGTVEMKAGTLPRTLRAMQSPLGLATVALSLAPTMGKHNEALELIGERAAGPIYLGAFCRYTKRAAAFRQQAPSLYSAVINISGKPSRRIKPLTTVRDG